MNIRKLVLAALLATAAVAADPAAAQVGKPVTVVDANTASEKDLLRCRR